MIEMALTNAHRLASPVVAVATTAMGLLAQVAPDTSVGQIGAVGTTSGLVVLLILLVEKSATPLLKWAEIQASARNDRARMEAELAHAKEQREADASRIAALEEGLAAAQQEAREAKNLVENAKIASDARAAAIEQKAREAGHLARNISQKIEIANQRLDEVEKVVGGSDDREPESAI